MNSSLQAGSLKVATVMGIPIRVHFSWLIIFGLITWSLATFYFPKAAPELKGLSYWINGIIASVLLFVSVALHELSHSFVAKRHGIAIGDITLFIFGGVAEMRSEPMSPKIEFRMAVAGPLLSFILAFIFFIAEAFVNPHLLKALFAYLSYLNLILGIFNLIPGFPMDGGRLLRAFLWRKTGDFFYATRKASSYGRKIALLFIIFGLVSIFTGHMGGLWLIMIGWFLHTASEASYEQASFQEVLASIKVKDIMVRDVVTISPEMTIETVVNEYFLKLGFGGFPVLGDGGFSGIITMKDIKNIPKDRWKDTISEILTPYEKRWEVEEDDYALKALELMISEDKGRLAVLKKGNLVGLITRNGIARYVLIARELKK